MSQYKITAKCNKTYDPVKDKNGNIVWDGKPKLIILTTGDEYVIKSMYERMKEYTDMDLWTLKVVKI